MPLRPSKRLLPVAVVGLFTIGLLVTAGVFLIRAWVTDPFPVLGLDSNPEQPIAFPHTVHAQDPQDGGLGIQCEFCHRNVTKGDAATVPAVQQCLFCHKTVVGVDNPEIDKLLEIAGKGEAIDWNRVLRLPDHVQFAHEPHIRFFTGPEQELPVGQVCSICHGDVASMTQVKQVRGLKMGDCVSCHKDNDAPTGCATCHY